ncbi:MAG: pyridoxal phosphate-dependent aminotransferase [Ignavibacteria bacterium]|nr:pyridoxal phosphate-dependent aminotransferase [Ignavibacteria bacterium]
MKSIDVDPGTLPAVDVERPGIVLSKRAQSMQASPLRKLAALAEARKRQGIKVYHLNIGQPDLPTHPLVFETIRNLKLETIAYAPSNGMPLAVQAWKKYFSHVGISFEESEIIVTAGGSEAIIFAMSAICDAEDEIIVFEPFYTNYNGFATLSNVRLRPIPLSIENGFHLPPRASIEEQIKERTKGILICNPSNPTGTIFTRSELETLVSIVREHDLYLLADEVYREFAYEAPFTSIMDFPVIHDRAILLDSTSKRFNVCGARVGVLASHNKEIVQAAFRFAMARLSVATIEQLALVPLLNDPQAVVPSLVEEFRRRRDVVYEGLAAIPGVTFYKPEGAFYIVIGLPIRDADHFSRWLVEEFAVEKETVLLAPAQGFYASAGKGTNEVRLAFMLNCSDLERSLKIIAAGLEQYKEKFQ